MQSNICISYLILLCNCHEDTAPTPLIFIFNFLNRICVNFSLHLMSTALKPEKGGRLRWIISTASMKLLKYALYAHVWNVCVYVCVYSCLCTIPKSWQNSMVFRGYWESLFWWFTFSALHQAQVNTYPVLLLLQSSEENRYWKTWAFFCFVLFLFSAVWLFYRHRVRLD